MHASSKQLLDCASLVHGWPSWLAGRPASIVGPFTLFCGIPGKGSAIPDNLYCCYLVEKEPHYYETVRDGQRKKIYEALPHTHHFHFRYQLLASEEDDGPKTYKTDMVTFGGVISKIYTDLDTRVVQGLPEEFEEKAKDGDVTSKNIFKFCWKHK